MTGHDAYWDGVRARLAAMGEEMPELVVEEPRPFNARPCPGCGFDSLEITTFAFIDSTGVHPGQAEIECVRPICPTNRPKETR